MTDQHAKQTIAMRYILMGRNYNKALRAMEIAREHHTGTRKDGVTPEFQHQVFIANFARTLESNLRYPDETLAAVFLHDICEDHDFSFKEIDQLFGDLVGNAVRNLTKKYKGEVVPYETYFTNMSKDPISSVVKGLDRIHNVFTMSDAGWTVEKKMKYLSEVNEYFYPMLKKARRLFVEQEPVYENIKTVLKMEEKLIRLSISSDLKLIQSMSSDQENNSGLKM